MNLWNWLTNLFNKRGNENEEDSSIKKQQEQEAKQKGDEFEKYIMKKLDQSQYFRIKEVTADKGFDIGVQVEATMNPDLIIEFTWEKKKIKKLFAIECKWRSKLFQGYFNWSSSEAQIERYKKFSKERQIPVFLALGLGGLPSDPEKLYIVPLKDIQNDLKEIQDKKQGMIYIKKLDNPKLGYLKSKKRGFFFDPEKEILQ